MNSKRNSFIIKSLLGLILVVFFINIYFTSQLFFNRSKYKTLESNIESIQTEKTKLLSENEKLKNEISKNEAKINEVIKTSKRAYLTFDDGPSNHTLKILDILDKYNIKATFFVNKKDNMDKIYKEISDRGHVIANHTATHNYKKIYKNQDNFIADVKALDDFIENITGKKPSKVLRFPGGSNNLVNKSCNNNANFMPELAQKMTDLGYTFFDWNIDSTDASAFRQKKDIIVKSILNNTPSVNTANILMHDLDPKDTTVDALPEIIEGLKSQGFIFDSLSHDSVKIQFTKVN